MKFFNETTVTVTKTTLKYVGPGSKFIEPWIYWIPPILVVLIVVFGYATGAFPRPPRGDMP